MSSLVLAVENSGNQVYTPISSKRSGDRKVNSDDKKVETFAISSFKKSDENHKASRKRKVRALSFDSTQEGILEPQSKKNKAAITLPKLIDANKIDDIRKQTFCWAELGLGNEDEGYFDPKLCPNGMPVGTFHLEYPDETFLEGLFTETGGKLRIEYPTGETYTGEVKRLKNVTYVPHGHGTLVYSCGSRFVGLFSEGLEEEGDYTMTHHVYKENDPNLPKFSGRGLIQYSNGDIYSGNILYGVPKGKGRKHLN